MRRSADLEERTFRHWDRANS